MAALTMRRGGGGSWVSPKLPEGYSEDPTSHLSVPSSASSECCLPGAAGNGTGQGKEVDRARPALLGVSVPETKAGINRKPSCITLGGARGGEGGIRALRAWM